MSTGTVSRADAPMVDIVGRQSVKRHRRGFVGSLALTSCVSLFACTSTQPPEAPSVAAVYAAVLHRYVAPGAVIESATVIPPPEARTVLPAGLPPELLSEFRRFAWEAAVPLSAGVELPAGIATVAPARLAEFSAAGGWAFWAEFERALPGANGLVSFSRVAFAPQRGEALLYFTHSLGSANGTGNLVMLRWKHGAWRVVSSSQLWVS